MTLTKRDVGKRFIAPSGEEIRLVKIDVDLYHFESTEIIGTGLVLSAERLFILERVKRTITRKMFA